MFRKLGINVERIMEGESREGTDERLETVIFGQHPLTVIDFLETVWQFRRANADADKEKFYAIERPDDFSDTEKVLSVRLFNPGDPSWHHLIYAYMIENTRIFDIFRRVIHGYMHGEQFGMASPSAWAWLRNTEMLFHRSAKSDSIRAVDSNIRPDTAAIRRNAYYRMFGMDLTHGTDDNKPYPFIKPKTSNREFSNSFEKLLRELWVGNIYKASTGGANPTDIIAIINHVTDLHNMLRDRRQNGTLQREEFNAVATMSWLHQTVSFDSSIVKSLNAAASSPFERLRKIGERVGLAPHSKTEDYFRLAVPISNILSEIELGEYDDENGAVLLYKGVQTENTLKIITHWASATGRSIKTDPQLRVTAKAS